MREKFNKAAVRGRPASPCSPWLFFLGVILGMASAKSRSRRHPESDGQDLTKKGSQGTSGNSERDSGDGRLSRGQATGTETPRQRVRKRSGEPQLPLPPGSPHRFLEPGSAQAAASLSIRGNPDSGCSLSPRDAGRVDGPDPCGLRNDDGSQPTNVDLALDRIEECVPSHPGHRLAALSALLRCRKTGIGGNTSAYCSCPACCAARWPCEDKLPVDRTPDTASGSLDGNPEGAFFGANV